MEIKKVKIEPAEGVNFICGQAHFIKSAEDLYEAMMNSAPGIKFGLAFCEASGPCLVRGEGNDPELTDMANTCALKVGAGHAFFIFMKNAFPLNVLERIKSCPEVCNIFCATANPVELLYVETEQGRGIVGVIDGYLPKGMEDDNARRERRGFLRRIGYKL